MPLITHTSYINPQPFRRLRWRILSWVHYKYGYWDPWKYIGKKSRERERWKESHWTEITSPRKFVLRIYIFCLSQFYLNGLDNAIEEKTGVPCVNNFNTFTTAGLNWRTYAITCLRCRSPKQSSNILMWIWVIGIIELAKSFKLESVGLEEIKKRLVREPAQASLLGYSIKSLQPNRRNVMFCLNWHKRIATMNS